MSMDLWFDYQSQQWKYLFEITRAIAARLDLDSVLRKALGNAVKYSPRGTCITVGGWVEPERIGVFARRGAGDSAGGAGAPL